MERGALSFRSSCRKVRTLQVWADSSVYDAEKGELLLCYAQGIWLRLFFVVPLELI
jgi:hypothetical protein